MATSILAVAVITRALKSLPAHGNILIPVKYRNFHSISESFDTRSASLSLSSSNTKSTPLRRSSAQVHPLLSCSRAQVHALSWLKLFELRLYWITRESSVPSRGHRGPETRAFLASPDYFKVTPHSSLREGRSKSESRYRHLCGSCHFTRMPADQQAKFALVITTGCWTIRHLIPRKAIVTVREHTLFLYLRHNSVNIPLDRLLLCNFSWCAVRFIFPRNFFLSWLLSEDYIDRVMSNVPVLARICAFNSKVRTRRVHSIAAARSRCRRDEQKNE